MIVLYYINNEAKPLKIFVVNQVAMIRQHSHPNQWCHIASELNPADIACRAMNCQTFLSLGQWNNGPDFLTDHIGNLNESQQDYLDEQKLLPLVPEIKKTAQACTATTFSCHPVKNFIADLSCCFSSWSKLKRIVAHVIKFVKCLKDSSGKSDKINNNLKERPLLTNYKLKLVESKILQYHQLAEFSLETKLLAKGNKLTTRCKLISLNPYLKENLIRVGGRIANFNLTYDSKHPIILNKNMPIKQLIINELHVIYGHAGRQFIMAKLREKYWVISANHLVRKCLNDCLVCKKRFKEPGKQLMADLPADRLEADMPPFTNTGIDYFGPFLVKCGRSTVKRYSVIFTCLTVRAVHLEVARDMSMDAFILALRHFLTRKGPVKLIRLDNGSNFVGAKNEMCAAIKEWNRSQINDFLLQKNIDWHFNSPYSSHHGRAWERLI